MTARTTAIRTGADPWEAPRAGAVDPCTAIRQHGPNGLFGGNHGYRSLRPRAAAVVAAAMAVGLAGLPGGVPASAATPRTIDTVAGGPGQGLATNLTVDPRGGLMVAGGHLFVGDTNIDMVRDVDLATGSSSLVQSTATSGHTVLTVTRDGAGNFYLFTGPAGQFPAQYQCQVVKVAPGGARTIVAGTGPGTTSTLTARAAATTRPDGAPRER